MERVTNKQDRFFGALLLCGVLAGMVYAYLRTIPPIVNRVPEYQPPTATQ